MAVIIAIGAVGWFAVSCGADRAGAERPVTEEEAAELAALRYRNHTSGPVAVRMVFPAGGEEVVVDGFLDWGRPLLYARMPGAEGGQRLVQAVPGLVATHADDEAFDGARVPDSGWTSRQMLVGGSEPADSVFDVLASSLFTLTAESGDDPAYLAEHAMWREDGVIDGEPVDTFRAPIMVESSEETSASPEALYSLDDQGDIWRFQVNVGGSELATVDFLRKVDFDASGLRPVDLLGGPAVSPAAVDGDLARTIAQVRSANWAESAVVEMTVPVADGQVARVHGSVDWRTMTAYLNVEEAEGHRLLLARPGGMASIGADSSELPDPLPAEGWEAHALDEEDIAEYFGPVETLAYRLLEMSAEEAADADEVAEQASQLRVDEAGGERTHVVEFPVAGDAEAASGESAFRYHITGERLSEVEMMTSFGVASAELEYEDYPMVAIPWAVSDVIG
ncbi:hypothetical protein [Glycomyces tenuis]|uniref:hypothetical protein n=1 Tax=Glycomyces tenuis TaxID=58116 RepID=UPI0012DDA043|nr:hypothetical protein [Glycomyces tenuis]